MPHRTDIISDLEEQISELTAIIEQMNRDHQSAQKLVSDLGTYHTLGTDTFRTSVCQARCQALCCSEPCYPGTGLYKEDGALSNISLPASSRCLWLW